MRALEAIGVLVGGLLIGYSIGAYSRQKYIQDELVEEVITYDTTALEEERESRVGDEEAKTDKAIFDKILKEENYIPYSKKSTEPESAEDEVEEDEETESEDEEYDYELDEIEALQEESTEEPYSISEDEFDANVYGYAQESWTYYVDDMLIADSYGNPVGTPEMFVGDAFDIMRNALDGTIMHWRAPQTRLEVELVASRDPYSESFVPQREELQRKAAEERKKGG